MPPKTDSSKVPAVPSVPTLKSEGKKGHLQTIEFGDFRKHVEQRSMWLGSKEASLEEFTVYDAEQNRMIYKKILISDALIKVADEVIQNCVDQYFRCGDAPKEHGGPVTRIDVHIENTEGSNLGLITIKNDGVGMPIEYNDEHKMWTVEGIIARQFTGSNLNDEDDPDRIVGGCNGLGMKLINICCHKLDVETTNLSGFSSQRKAKIPQYITNNRAAMV